MTTSLTRAEPRGQDRRLPAWLAAFTALICLCLAPSLLQAVPNLTWSIPVDSGASTADRTRAIGMMTNGDVIVATQTGVGAAANINVQRLASGNGANVWTRNINSSAISEDAADLVVNPATGETWIATRYFDSTNQLEWAILKLNGATGTIDGTYTYGTTGNDEPRAITFTPDGNVVVVGMETNTTSGLSRARIVKLNSSASLLWSDTSATDSSDYLDVVADSSGNVYACGHQGTAALVVKYTGGGAVTWTQPLSGTGSGNSNWNAITLLSTGDVVVAGSLVATGQGGNFVLARYPAAGGVATWTHADNGSGNADEMAYDVTVDASDNIYAAGFLNTSTGLNAYGVKVNAADGSTAWSATVNGLSSTALAADAFYNVRVIGTDVLLVGTQFGTTTNADLLISRYSTAGALQEHTVFNGAANNFDTCLNKNLLATNGTVFAIGGDTENATPSTDGIVRSYSLGPPPPAPEINVKGNGNTIADGDSSPSSTDHTDFGNATLGVSTVVRTFTIENTGDAVLNLTGTPKVVVGGTNAADFSVTALPSSPVAITNGTTTFQVTFTPGGTGLRTASLSIANDDADENPYDFAIQATGVCPTVTVTNPSVASGSQNVAFSQTFTQSGALAPVAFTLATGTLPSGITLASTGVLSGTTSQLGSFPITVKATGLGGCNGTGATYTLVINPPVGPITFTVGGSPGDASTNSGAPDNTGAADGNFNLMGRGGYLSANGVLGFPGTLKIAGAVTAQNNQGYWKDAGTGLKRLVRSSDVMLGTGGASLDALPTIPVPGINSIGQVTLLGTLRIGTGTVAVTANDDTAMWSEAGGSGLQLLARENDPVTGVSGAFIASFGFGCYATATTGVGTGEAAFTIKMKGATTQTALIRRSITGPGTGTNVIIAREASAAPGVAGQNFAALNGSLTSAVRMDPSGNLVFEAQMKPNNKLGIWYQPVGGSVAKVLVANDTAPGTSGATFASFDLPSMGSGGTVAFSATLNANGDNATNAKNSGIWRGVGTGAYTCILRRGDPALPGMVVGSKVGNLWNGWLNLANHGAWKGWVDTAGDGISPFPADTFGIYSDIGGTMRLLISSGDAAPGVVGSTMFAIDHPVVSGNTVGSEYVAFLGTVTGGGVTAGVNDKAVWRSTNGAAPTLVLRTGDSMTTSQGSKTVFDIDIPGSGQDVRPWEQSVMDDTGRILLIVTFTDGSTSQVIAQ